MNIFESFQRKKDFLICIDSDGCAMDTMDIKHIQCFGPCMVKEWGLEAWQDEILKRWNEINLYSMTRGINRFKGLALALREIDESYCKIEELQSLENWVETTKELSNASVEKEALATGSIALKKALSWSQAVNRTVAELPESVKKPFDGVGEALKKAHEKADIAIVSSANREAVTEEWENHGLLSEVDIMLTQDAGSKAFCIGEMLKKGYAPEQVLMIGDAPGDKKAAETNGVLYYPILVRKEGASWEKFKTEALDVFLKKAYRGEYENQRIAEFIENLS